MDGPKRKISVTLDAELLAELEQGAGSTSAQLNEAMRAEIMRRRQRDALATLLDHLEETDGPLDTAEDAAEMARMEEIWRSLEQAAVEQEPATPDRARRAS
ncbi:MAG: type II toxin-antitoxin system CcdA family antitoxin [Pseudonocardia sp.]|nr:type II toxin-antitoxin system CcdA family antitoxin [Pseudonocardia sp.]